MAEAPPTPIPSPPPPASHPSISAEINAATRKAHTELNRLIIDLLPLALPPKAHDPALLGTGLAAFAQIFFSFEQTWDIIEAAERKLSNGDKQEHKNELLVRLAQLRPPGLQRSERLKRELEHIRAVTGVDVVSAAPKIKELDATTLQKPHVLIAYAWVMYMAIFSGGRWIRHKLAEAGPAFWKSQDLPSPSDKHDDQDQERLGYSFLFFDSEEDGEDIKRDFKTRLTNLEELLSPQQRQDIVEEAQKLFEHCIELVHALDRQIELSLVQKIINLIAVAIMLSLLLAGFAWMAYYHPEGPHWRRR